MSEKVREGTMNPEVSCCIRQSPVMHANHKAKMLQKKCTQEDSVFDVGYDKNPTEGLPKANVEIAGTYTIGRDARTVNSL